MKGILLFILILVLLPSIVMAKAFVIDKQDSGTYFKGNYGMSNISGDAFKKSSGSQTGFTDEVNFNWGGELGFMFPRKDFNLRLGLEIIHPQKLSLEGKDASGTKLLDLETSVYGYFPVLHLEFYGLKSSFGRAYMSIGGGYGQVKVVNKYSLTAAGTAQYTGVTDYTEKVSQFTYLVESALGYELYFASSSTIVFDLGYRYSKAENLKHDDTATTFNGGVASGDNALNSDGKKRALDLSGAFIGLGLRFYFNF